MKKYNLLLTTILFCSMLTAQDTAKPIIPDYIKLLENCNAKIKKDPSYENYLEREEIYFKLYYASKSDKYEELALQDLELAIGLINDSILLAYKHYDAGYLYWKLNKFEKAYIHSNIAIVVDSLINHVTSPQTNMYRTYGSAVDLLCLRGLILVDQNKFDDGMQDFQKAKLLKASSGYPIYCFGVCYSKLKKTDLALSFFKEAIKIDKWTPDAYIQIAIIYDEKGDYLEAIKYLELGKNYSAYSKESYIRLAKLYKQSGDNIKACENAKLAINELNIRISYIPILANELESQINQLTLEYCGK